MHRYILPARCSATAPVPASATHEHWFGRQALDLTALRNAVAVASDRYHRLVLVVGSDEASRRSLLHEYAAEVGTPVVGVSAVLSEALLPLPRADRIAEVGPLLERLIAETSPGAVCLDNIEVLFVPDLRVDVLSRLQQLSRTRTLVVHWPGHWTDGDLTYAEAGHPEYFQARADAATVFNLSGAGPSLP
jgi:hypothetical protein